MIQEQSGEDKKEYGKGATAVTSKQADGWLAASGNNLVPLKQRQMLYVTKPTIAVKCCGKD